MLSWLTVDASMDPPNQTAYRCMWCVMTCTSMGLGYNTKTLKRDYTPKPQVRIKLPGTTADRPRDKSSQFTTAERFQIVSTPDVIPQSLGWPSVCRRSTLRSSSGGRPLSSSGPSAGVDQSPWTWWTLQTARCSTKQEGGGGMRWHTDQSYRRPERWF